MYHEHGLFTLPFQNALQLCQTMAPMSFESFTHGHRHVFRYHPISLHYSHPSLFPPPLCSRRAKKITVVAALPWGAIHSPTPHWTVLITVYLFEKGINKWIFCCTYTFPLVVTHCFCTCAAPTYYVIHLQNILSTHSQHCSPIPTSSCAMQCVCSCSWTYFLHTRDIGNPSDSLIIVNIFEFLLSDLQLFWDVTWRLLLV